MSHGIPVHPSFSDDQERSEESRQMDSLLDTSNLESSENR